MMVCNNCKVELSDDSYTVRWEKDWSKKYDFCSWECIVEFGKKKLEVV